MKKLIEITPEHRALIAEFICHAAVDHRIAEEIARTAVRVKTRRAATEGDRP